MVKKYKLVPQFRENCIVQGNENWVSELVVGDTIFLISDTPTKRYSIISKIDAIEHHNESKILIDKRILGNFAKGDEVFILKYNPAEALEVHISISDEYSAISKGDWTTNIKPSLLDKLIDLGQEISFLIPWEGGAPIIGTGIISTTLPNTPVYIGEQTRIFLNKLSVNELSELKKKKISEQEMRIEILRDQISQKTIQLLREIKQKNYPNKGQKYLFKATNPRQLFNSVLGVFKGLDVIEAPTENFFDEEEQEYLASAVFALKQEESSYQLIDIQISSSGYSGMLVIWVNGERDDIILQTLDNYDARISQLQQGLEQKVEVFSARCPECGGALSFEDIDVKGVVKCIYCASVSKVPKALRY